MVSVLLWLTAHSSLAHTTTTGWLLASYLLLQTLLIEGLIYKKKNEDFYFQEQMQAVIKPRFYPLLCQFLMEIIMVKTLTECAHASKRVSISTESVSVEDDNFLMAGWGCVNLMILI